MAEFRDTQVSVPRIGILMPNTDYKLMVIQSFDGVNMNKYAIF